MITPTPKMMEKMSLEFMGGSLDYLHIIPIKKGGVNLPLCQFGKWTHQRGSSRIGGFGFLTGGLGLVGVGVFFTSSGF